MAKICRLEKSKYEGFDSYLLTNGHLEICLVPELGGKLTSIRHLLTGREWLWRNPHLPLRPVTYDGSFVANFDTGGLDECFPAVSGGPFPTPPWEGVTIPDHGECWCQPWDIKIVKSSADNVVIWTGCHGVRFPYQFERTLTLSTASPHIQLDYQVSNLTAFDMPFIWSIHPILQIEKGMQIYLPRSVNSVQIDTDLHGFLGEAHDWISWPEAVGAHNQSVPLFEVPAPEFGQAYKLYAPLFGESGPVETTLADPTGDHQLTFRFDSQEITHIGIWMNYGGWSGSGSAPYFNLGLEPCIGGTDDLSQASERGEAAILPAKKSRRWSLEIWVR